MKKSITLPTKDAFKSLPIMRIIPETSPLTVPEMNRVIAIFQEDDPYIHIESDLMCFLGNDGTDYATLINVLAHETFTQLDVDGGVKTAEFLLDRIRAGKIDGGNYISRDCGCLYGTMVLAQIPNITWDEMWDDVDGLNYEDIHELEIVAKSCAINYYKATRDPVAAKMGWDEGAGLTPAEFFVRRVDHYETPQNNGNLAVLAELMAIYIKNHPVAA